MDLQLEMTVCVSYLPSYLYVHAWKWFSLMIHSQLPVMYYDVYGTPCVFHSLRPLLPTTLLRHLPR